MPRFEDLHPDQQAVLQLVLGRGRDYGDIGRMLGTRAERVRDRALDAVDGLAPEDVDGLDLDGRERITDFLLGQQDPVAAEGTRQLLSDSAPARAWARTVSGQLEPLATGRSLPGVDSARADSGRRAARGRRGAPAATAPPADDRSDAAADAFGAASASAPTKDAWGKELPARSADVSTAARGDAGERHGSRGGAIAMLVGLVLVVVLVVLLATGVLGGSDDETAAGPAPTTTSADASSTAQQINFDPVGGTSARGVGFAQVVDETPVLLFQGEGFPRTRTSENPTAARPNRYYAVWLDGGAAPRRLGFLDEVGADGKVERLVIQLPRDVSQWRRAVITEESAEDPRSPGTPIVRADLADVTGG